MTTDHDQALSANKVSFGRDVLGPIFAEFTLRLWMYVSSLDQQDSTALLFCARGGLRLQFLYELFLQRANLETPVLTDSLMISRIIAVRPALLAGAASAYEQIDYEFSGDTLRDVAKALCGVDPVDAGGPAEPWSVEYTPAALRAILKQDSGQPVLVRLRDQAALFRQHLERRAAGRRRIVLCDTGLFGSTMQLLEDGMPDFSWSSCLFARANYKHLPSPHFSRTIGLSVEADQYSPLDRRTAVLRYWHIIEAVLEPDLPSASGFAPGDERPKANLEIDRWQDRVGPEPGTIFAGVTDYFKTLTPETSVPRVFAESAGAWTALHRAIVWPTRADGEILDFNPRSEDFGRTGFVSIKSEQSSLLNTLRTSLWKEGAIARLDSLFKPLWLLGLEIAYSARWLRRVVGNAKSPR